MHPDIANAKQLESIGISANFFQSRSSIYIPAIMTALLSRMQAWMPKTPISLSQTQTFDDHCAVQCHQLSYQEVKDT
jgi:hypothetical protein